MPNERENLYQTLTYKDYDIAGLTFRAYYDADEKLVFVLDTVINEIKPNVMLVINPVGDRKWDDILANDYGLDLETVRPKKDNKYQKLDVEYTGLAEYDALIQADKISAVDNVVLGRMGQFISGALKRAANERLADAELTADKARETIEKTNETIAQQQERLKTLRAKLVVQRRDVGKEPTKQSAAKILRTESQIEATNDKLGRAKKRVVNAKHRLAIAEEDADAARAILVRLDDVVTTGAHVPAMPMPTDVAEVEVPSVPMQVMPQFTEITTFEEPPVPTQGADDMADEEVKPLFDKDPDILDEEIAFKPIDFSVPANPGAMVSDSTPEPTVSAPLSFVPPVQTTPAPAPVEEVVELAPVAMPVLDSLTPVELPSQQIDSELMPDSGFVLPSEQVTPVQQPIPDNIAPLVDTLPSQAQSAPQPMPEISPAPIGAGMRPVSPITGSPDEVVTPVRHKPTVLYYVMLVVLIILSVFTLWIYQRSANDTTPELGAQTQVDVAEGAQPQVVDTNIEEVPSPFIETVVEEPVNQVVSVVAESEPEPVVVDIEPEPVVVTPAVPVGVVADVEPAPVPVTPEPESVVADVAEPETMPVVADDASPFLTDEVVESVPPKPIVDVVVNKPVYNVSQNEKMFVADPEYETDEPVEYYEPAPATQAEIIEEVAETCADGAAPDADGCCSGEELVDMGGEFMCCVIGTDECFPPML